MKKVVVVVGLTKTIMRTATTMTTMITFSLLLPREKIHIMIEKEISEALIKSVQTLYGQDLPEKLAQVQKTRSEFEGDYTVVVFPLLRMSRKKPEDTANELGVEMQKQLSFVSGFNVVKGFLNLSVSDKYWLNDFAVNRQDETFGILNVTEGDPFVIEYSSPNTNKPLHLGHIRNNILGWSVAEINKAAGKNVKKVNLVNDRGIHICKSMLAYQKWGNNKEPDKKPDHFVGDFYVLFCQKAKENPKLEEEAKEMLRKWEAGDKEVRDLWKKMNSWAEKGFEETYKRFNVRFDKIYKESEMYEKGKEMVLQGLKKGIFQKDKTGAIFFDLSNHGLDKKILIRSDGTTLYITQDLYLAYLKYKDFLPDKSIYVVANEQNYHFEVLFKLLEELKKLGYKFARENIHLSYGMVNLPSGRMKSREGKIVDADDLMDEMKEKAKIEIKKRNKLDKEKLEELSHKISLAAIKFFLLKYDEIKDFTFYPEESLSMEGETGPYLQYSLVRAKKILEKSKEKAKVGELVEEEEFELVKKISKFPEVLRAAAYRYKPHFIANYAYELAYLFSRFYEACPVIKSKKEKERLALIESFAQIMKLCLKLLGIEEVELM